MTTMLKDYHRALVQSLTTALDREQHNLLAECYRAAPQTSHLIQLLVERVQGGKRLRALLVQLAYHMCAPLPHRDTIMASLAYEVFQTSILIHDDIIDRSPLRRGMPTIHTLFPNAHYGTSQAIALADLGYFWAIRLFQRLPFPAEVILRAQERFLYAMSMTCVGEVLDVDLATKQDVALADLETVHHLKTGIYTLIGPMQIGATLAGAGEQAIEKLTEFGKYLGLAFQIRDDVIGIFGEDDQTGKSALSDIEEGKKTYLLAHALEKASAAQLQELKMLYGKACTQEGLQRIRQIFTDTGALQASETMISDYSTQALACIDHLAIAPSYAQILQELVEYLCHRKN
jgi:geranylgeranyl diphosphate synthase type I